MKILEIGHTLFYQLRQDDNECLLQMEILEIGHTLFYQLDSFCVKMKLAANLVLSDLSLAQNPSTGTPLLTNNGLPH